MSTMPPDLDELSHADEAEWEVETLPDNDVDEAAASGKADPATGAVAASSQTRALEDQNRMSQAAKAIEAAEAFDRVSPPESLHERQPTYMSSSALRSPARTANATEETPLLDAGPAQPPPDYAAATAGRRAMFAEEVDVESGNSVMSAQTSRLQRPAGVGLPSTLPRAPESMTDPPPSTPTSMRKRRPSTLSLVCLGVYMLLYFLLLGAYKGVCYLGAGVRQSWSVLARTVSGTWRYCWVVSAFVLALVISAGVVGVVLILLKKEGVT